uniref:Serpentine receptor class gamma n=1 Tax=Caenorhabditis tropicalis TaxID=1561998 RepID=A0A1I7TXP9_9PELO
MQLDLSTQLPKVASYLFDVAGIVDFLTNSLVIYLILWKSSNMKTFRFYLLYFQLTTAVMDFYLAFLMKPIPVFPVIGGYTEGILYRFFGLSAHYQMTIQVFLMSVQEVSILCAFLRKHQSIVPITKTKEWKKTYYWGLIVMAHSITLVVVILYLFSNVTREQQLEYIQTVSSMS